MQPFHGVEGGKTSLEVKACGSSRLPAVTGCRVTVSEDTKAQKACTPGLKNISRILSEEHLSRRTSSNMQR